MPELAIRYKIEGRVLTREEAQQRRDMNVYASLDRVKSALAALEEAMTEPLDVTVQERVAVRPGEPGYEEAPLAEHFIFDPRAYVYPLKQPAKD